LDELPIGGQGELRWRLQADESGNYDVGLTLKTKWNEKHEFAFSLPVIDRKTPSEELSNESIHVACPGDSVGYGRMLIGASTESSPLAVIDCLAEVIYEDSHGKVFSQKLFAKDLRFTGRDAVEFSGRCDAMNEGSWRINARLALPYGSKTAKLDVSLSSDAERKILAFISPALRIGDSTKKEGAQYPGIEYLDQDEPSSDPRDFDPVFTDRSIPKTRDVTIPLMSVRTPNGVAGLLWDNTHEWAPGEKGMRGWFASPNSVNDQGNHLAALIVPSGLDDTEPNVARATEAFILKPGEKIDVSCRLYVAEKGDALSAVDAWIDQYGLPTLKGPEVFERAFDLARHGMLFTCWEPKAPGWIHSMNRAVNSKPLPIAYDCLSLLLDGARMPESDMGKLLMERGLFATDYLLNNIGKHPALYRLPFHMGRVPKTLERQRNNASHWMKKQREDGSWPFTPKNKHAEALGGRDETEIGICANAAMNILQYARITGDEAATQSGLKALERMRQFTIPRAAQVWEITLHSPDILASAKAVECFLEGYMLTGDEIYLDEAVRWARTSLPFIYLWDDGEHATLPYSSIAVLGSTYWRNTWVGRPVQWCGQDTAGALLRLSQYDDSRDWRHIAKGITQSAALQLVRDGEFKGLLPDFWLFDPDRGDGPMINPVKFHRAALTLEGHPPYVNTERIQIGGETVRISSGSEIEVLDSDEDKKTVSIKLSDPLLGTSYLFVADGGKPASITVNGTALPEVEDPDAVDSGWCLTELNGAYAKIHNEKKAVVDIRF